MTILRYSILTFLVCTLLFSCSEETSETEFQLSPRVDSILRDSAPAGYVADSLKEEYFLATSDTQRIDILNELSHNLRAADMELAEEAYRLSIRLNYLYGVGDAICHKGIAIYRGNEYDSARTYFMRCKSIADSLRSDKLAAQAISWNADAYRMQGEKAMATKHYNDAILLAERCGAPSITAFCYSSLGSMFYTVGEYDSCIIYSNRALEIAKLSHDKNRMCFCYASLGKAYDFQGNYAAALSHFLQAKELAIEINNKILLSFCLNSIGSLYRQTNDTANAIISYEQAYEIAVEIEDRSRTSYALAFLGDMAREQKRITDAIDYYRRAIPIGFAAEDTTNVVYAYNGLGDALRMAEQPDSAIHYFNVSLSLCDTLYDGIQIANNMMCIADVYYEQHQFALAESWALTGSTLSEALQIPEYERDAYDRLYKIYKATGKDRLALEMYERATELNNNIVNIENVRKFEEEEYKARENSLKTVQAEKDAVTEKDKILRARELELQTYISYAAGGGGLLALVCLVFAVRGYRNKRRANEAIQLQKEKVEQQKSIIEEKNKAIVDSINYAQRIQTALFPPEQKVKDVFGECFVLYLPKDIVSGDFYWIENAKDGSKLLAAADCTGHGVPGALVSVVGNNALNRAVREFGLTDPGRILDKLNELVAETFAQSESEVKDGMDISLLSLKRSGDNTELKWAGANNNLWHFHDETVIELKADRRPIGKHDKTGQFTTHTRLLQKNDNIYIFTDGFADQFGGAKGKKFKYKGLQNLLLSIHQLDAKSQKEKLHAAFEEWRGSLEQVDDVLVIGVKT